MKKKLTDGALWQVAAEGHFQTYLGRRCFPFSVAVAMAADLRNRGYADAHAQRWLEGDRALPPLPLTLSVGRGRS